MYILLHTIPECDGLSCYNNIALCMLTRNENEQRTQVDLRHR